VKIVVANATLPAYRDIVAPGIAHFPAIFLDNEPQRS
jgi:hypothetical protein